MSVQLSHGNKDLSLHPWLGVSEFVYVAMGESGGQGKHFNSGRTKCLHESKGRAGPGAHLSSVYTYGKHKSARTMQK